MTGMVRAEGKTVCPLCRDIARTMATSKVEFFVTIVNNLKPLRSLFTFPFQQCRFEARLVGQPFLTSFKVEAY